MEPSFSTVSSSFVEFVDELVGALGRDRALAGRLDEVLLFEHAQRVADLVMG